MFGKFRRRMPAPAPDADALVIERSTPEEHHERESIRKEIEEHRRTIEALDAEAESMIPRHRRQQG